MSSHVPLGFLLGERDPANRRVKPLIRALESAGVPLVVDEMLGVGHDLPADFAARASTLLVRLLDAASPQMD
jgi:hypothetical protein